MQEGFPERVLFKTQRDFRSALMIRAKLSFREVAVASGRSTGMVGHVIAGRFKSRPLAETIYGMLKDRCPDMPFSFDEMFNGE